MNGHTLPQNGTTPGGRPTAYETPSRLADIPVIIHVDDGTICLPQTAQATSDKFSPGNLEEWIAAYQGQSDIPWVLGMYDWVRTLEKANPTHEGIELLRGEIGTYTVEMTSPGRR